MMEAIIFQPHERGGALLSLTNLHASPGGSKAVVPHIVLDVTDHGFGHLGQAAPVIAALKERRAAFRLTVRTGIPPAVVGEFLGMECRFAEKFPEIGMVMSSPIDVRVEDSLREYRAVHDAWDAVVEMEARRLADLAPTLLVSAVGYVGLAAAARAGVPAVALSSLNWADMVRSYCADRPGAAAIHDRMREAYCSAQAFIQVTPHLPMPDFPNRRSVGPVARIGRDRRREVAAIVGAAPAERLALASLGGMQGGGGIRSLPRVPGLRWLVNPELAVDRDDTTPLPSIPIPFIDILRSCDLVVTKPAYGMIVESVCNGVRVVYCERDDWPETPIMHAWAETHGLAAMVGRGALSDGSYGDTLADLLDRPAPAPVAPTGAAEAAGIIDALL